ncbi:hypothetical protein JCM24511_03532 [Saitozyma sp. JCM 24511]|nr:hypothetical protein JCM24511_03532 [Saitozyma sp. JCM 24511]
MSEKSSLPLPTQSAPTRPARSLKPRILFLLLTTLLLSPILLHSAKPALELASSTARSLLQQDDAVYDWSALESVQCPVQPEALFPKTMWNMTSEEKEVLTKHYAEAVSFDDNGEPLEDPRWGPFFDFQKWLKTAFPLANSKAKVEYINTLGIIATFEGSDTSLKPLLLMSHYDVVPAPESTYDRWTHGAFSGFNDGKYIWGRGAADDKPLVVSQWEAITKLLSDGFVPRRTIILSHGNDEEEVFARRGQGHIAPFLEERYGKDGLLMVIDEGSGNKDDFFGASFALPAMGEKGYMDIVLTPHSPYLTSLMCAAKHSPSFPKKWSSLLKSEGPKSWPKLAKLLASQSRLDRAMVGTTTAVDVVNGGVKVNALPELVTAKVNFRIDFSESVESTKDHVAKILAKVAKKNGLEFSGFKGKDTKELGGKFVQVELMGQPLEPAPNTPTEGGVWDLFAGTVKAVAPGPNGEERIVTPFASTGNTDCKMYYNLTKNVFRYMGGPSGGSGGVHTVDEHGSIAAQHAIARWVHAIIQNADAYDGEE